MQIDPSNLERRELFELVGRSISPLPVVLVSTVSPDGIYNAAPYSFVSPISYQPPRVSISFGLREGQKKDTLRNIESSHDFVLNIVDEALIGQTVKTSADYADGVDETKEVGLTSVKSEMVRSPRIREAKISMECRLVHELEIPEKIREGKGLGLRAIVFGEIILWHISKQVWIDGKINSACPWTVGRVGPELYCRTGDVFKIEKPEGTI